MGRKNPEINASSMADIAFLLLVFFLVTTTIDSDKGLTVKLPPMPEDEEDIIDSRQNKRNVLMVLVNSKDQLLVNDDPIPLNQLKEKTLDHVLNKADKHKSGPKAGQSKAVVSVKNDKGTSYDTYVMVHNELKAAYNQIWDDESMSQFGRKYEALTTDQKKQARKKFPYKISEAEPEEYGKQ